MEIKINTNKKNELLKRTLLEGEFKFDAATPSNNEMAEELAKIMKGEVSLVVVKRMAPDFGMKEGEFKAYIYDSNESRDKLERMTKHLKKQAEEKAKKEAEEKKVAEETAAKEVEQPKEEAETEATATEEVKEEAAEEKKSEEAEA